MSREDEEIDRSVVLDGVPVNWKVSVMSLIENCVGVFCQWMLLGCPENMLGNYGSQSMEDCEEDCRLNVLLSFLVLRVMMSLYHFECMESGPLYRCLNDPTTKELIPLIWKKWIGRFENREAGSSMNQGMYYVIEEFKLCFSDLDDILFEVLGVGVISDAKVEIKVEKEV